MAAQNTPEQSKAPTDSSPKVFRGTNCVACGYDLGGLGGAGVCPECGGPIAASLLENPPNPLIKQAARWGNGALLGTAGAVGGCVLLGLLVLGNREEPGWIGWVGLAMFVGAPLCVLRSYWLFLQGLPAALREGAWGRAVRFAAIAAAVITIAIMVSATAGLGLRRSSETANLGMGLVLLGAAWIRNHGFVLLTTPQRAGRQRWPVLAAIGMNLLACVLWGVVLLVGLLRPAAFPAAMFTYGAAGFGVWIVWLSYWLGTLEYLSYGA